MKIILIITVFLNITHSQNFQSFYQDVRGRQAGDVLTVLVTETSNASRESRTNVSSNAGMSLDGSVSGTFSKYLPLFGAQSSTSSNMDGNEGSQIKDRLEAKVSVTILEDKKNRFVAWESEGITNFSKIGVASISCCNKHSPKTMSH